MSSDTQGFADDLGDQSYEFKDELKIRKVLEKHTTWEFEFSKNGQYKYDLAITKWDNEPRNHDDNEVVGYVELERSRKDKEHSWVTGGIPDSWYFLSFLQRKVRSYDHRRESWGGVLDNYDQTVYLKFNHALDNCFAAPIETIYRDGETTPRSTGSYNDTYLKLETDHSEVRFGVDSCVNFIEDYLTRREPGQANLSLWSDSL